MTTSIRSIIRQFGRQKAHTSILVGGLALGIAAFVMIAQYITDEWQSNRFHSNFDNLHRLSVIDAAGESQLYLPPGYKTSLENSVSGIKTIVRTTENLGAGTIQYEGTGSSQAKIFKEESIFYVDKDYLRVFTFPLLAGIADLSVPHTLALSESIATKIFGSVDPIGQSLVIDNQFGRHFFS